MRMPPTAACRKTSSVRLLAVLPRGNRVGHVPCRRLEGIPRVVRAPLHLKDDGLDAGVLPGLVELHGVPGHDELVARDRGSGERLADGLRVRGAGAIDGVEQRHDAGERAGGEIVEVLARAFGVDGVQRPGHRPFAHEIRSEEHTSELQSLAYLVCRLLLEKKKKKTEKNALTQHKAM